MFILDARVNQANAGAVGASNVNSLKNIMEANRKTEGGTTKAKDEASNTQTTAPPQPKVLSEAERYHAAIIKTGEAAKRIIYDVAELQLKDGQQAARQVQDNKIRQAYELADNCSTQAKRAGIPEGAAHDISLKTRSKYSENPNFDPDAIEVAALFIEDSIGGSIT